MKHQSGEWIDNRNPATGEVIHISRGDRQATQQSSRRDHTVSGRKRFWAIQSAPEIGGRIIERDHCIRIFGFQLEHICLDLAGALGIFSPQQFDSIPNLSQSDNTDVMSFVHVLSGPCADIGMVLRAASQFADDVRIEKETHASDTSRCVSICRERSGRKSSGQGLSSLRRNSRNVGFGSGAAGAAKTSALAVPAFCSAAVICFNIAHYASPACRRQPWSGRGRSC